MPDQNEFVQGKARPARKIPSARSPAIWESEWHSASRNGNIAPLSVTQQQYGCITTSFLKSSRLQRTLTIHRTGLWTRSCWSGCLQEMCGVMKSGVILFDGSGEELVQIVHPSRRYFRCKSWNLSQVPKQSAKRRRCV